MKPIALPACDCNLVFDDTHIHYCEKCKGFTLGEQFGHPIEKFKGSYNDGRKAQESCRTDT